MQTHNNGKEQMQITEIGYRTSGWAFGSIPKRYQNEARNCPLSKEGQRNPQR